VHTKRREYIFEGLQASGKQVTWNFTFGILYEFLKVEIFLNNI